MKKNRNLRELMGYAILLQNRDQHNLRCVVYREEESSYGAAYGKLRLFGADFRV